MEKFRGELWEGRAVDGKLKSSLEWPYLGGGGGGKLGQFGGEVELFGRGGSFPCAPLLR